MLQDASELLSSLGFVFFYQNDTCQKNKTQKMLDYLMHVCEYDAYSEGVMPSFFVVTKMSKNNVQFSYYDVIFMANLEVQETFCM